MTTAQSVPSLARPSARIRMRWVEKNFYLCMSLLVAAVVTYGFGGTIDRKLIHADPPRPALLWVHVVLFSTWLVFYIVQSALVRVRKVGLHRTLGWAGAMLGTAMVAIGFWVAVVMARFDMVQLHRPNREAFVIVPLFDMVVFTTCFALAVLWRTRPERHRRLMFLATCALTGAAFGRMSMLHAPLGFYGGIDVLIVCGVLRDLAVSRRVHPVYRIAIPLVLAGQVAVSEIFLHRAGFWISIAHRLLA